MSTATEIRESEVRQPLAVREQIPTLSPSQRLPRIQSERLFSSVLLETSGIEHRRWGFAAVLSFVFQCFVLGLLIIVPLMFTDALPEQQLLTYLMAPPPPPPPPPAASSAAAARVIRRVESEVANGRLRMPGKIPQNIQMIREDEAPPDLSGGGVPGGVPGGIPGGQVGGVIGGVIGGILSSKSTASAIPKLAVPAPPKRIRISQGVTEGRLILRIKPPYPPLARAARVQGPGGVERNHFEDRGDREPGLD
jgi:periplasmic protein TonB